MHHTSRSAVEAFRRCRRKYFYQYAYQGTGFVSPRVYEAPTLGSALHIGMPLILQSEGKAPAVKAAVDAALSYWQEETKHGFLDVEEMETVAHQEEGEALIEGMLRAWNRSRRVRFLEEYRPLYTEEEFDLVLSPEVCFDSRPDLIVEDILGRLWVIDWKSVSRAYDWGSRFKREPQSYTQPHVAEARLGRPIHGTIYEGLWKGNSSGSILIRGVRNTKTGAYSPYASDAKRADFERFNVWNHRFDLQGSMTPIEYWVNWLPEEIVRDQFLTPQPIPFEKEHAAEFFRTTLQLTEQIQETLEDYQEEVIPIDHVLDFFYPSESDWNCQGCQYESNCWSGVDITRLIKEKKLVPRKDHHAKKALSS